MNAPAWGAAGTLILAVFTLLGVRLTSRATRSASVVEDRRVDIEEWRSLLHELRTSLEDTTRKLEETTKRVGVLERAAVDKDRYIAELRGHIWQQKPPPPPPPPEWLQQDHS